MATEYTLEQLSDTLGVYVTREHHFGTDACLLSWYADVKASDRVCDLGTGCGIIPLLWYRTRKPAEVYAVDIQQNAIEQLRASVAYNRLDAQIHPVLGDLKDLKGLVPFCHFDVVTCNPPYKLADSGLISKNESHRIARHEIACNINDVCAAAAKLLKFGGRLVLCQRPERLADVLLAMRENRIEPKKLRFVQQKADAAPWLFLVTGRCGAGRYLEVEPPLIMENADGVTEQIKEIYLHE